MFNNYLRFVMVFFCVSFTVFELQAILSQQWGSRITGQRMSSLMSIGQIFLTGSFLAFGFRPSHQAKTIATTLLIVVLPLCVLVTFPALRSSGGFLLVYVLLILFGAVAMMATSSEAAFILQGGWPLLRVRPLGSLGFLCGAIASQWSHGDFMLAVIPANFVLLVLPRQLPTSPRNTIEQANKSAGLSLSFGAVLGLGLTLGFISKGFDVTIPFVLRDQTKGGLYWLSVMIASEIMFLLLSSCLKSTTILLAAPIAWALAYLLMIYPAQPTCIVAAMMLVGFNCTWQTTLFAAESMRHPLEGAYRQCQLSATITAGGILFVLATAASSLDTQSQLLLASHIAAILGLPIVLSILRSSFVKQSTSN